ncbi:unnamed protein product [Tuber melanosporum]|uniref:Mitochondrial distribution and morphology protein 34 n=1 Tax=Tuber melanosporum (strain Mel28) TaxID=656061 RepID=D5GKG0_TUBMM|nr:uncharacterized protein GSTUM_00009526001 [Tuber melanosporum]CAZ85003.1 unnamed protein product [Tuber melanosporum]
MAFNFNWAPLTTSNTSSSAFYSHAKSLLTAALNKSQKPPIIVDDIFVEELNLGQSAPELEILEIGDLAEDRFRGIFRLGYDGDAFLTLRTKVQVNPLNTYLSTTPSYTSPMPLAASSPLTIPLQITLSHFRLSGFIILVFSKAKGVTLVFRNDPLESLKVSSTFDTIPFIKDYLQEEIERQVRRLFQEELPVAVHRLSLRLWNPEYAASLGLDAHDPDPSSPIDGIEDGSGDDAMAALINPLLSPSDNSDTPSIAFSQKNLVALKELSEAQKTLSIRTPGISDAVFRVWASGGGSSSAGWERSVDAPSTLMGPRTYTFSDTGEAISSAASISSRPGLATSSSVSTGGGVSTPGTRTRGKKKKHRVVNLRPTKESTHSDPAPDKPTTSTTQTTITSAGRKEEDLPTPQTPTFPSPPQPQLIPSTPTTPTPTSSPFSQEERVVFESPVSPTSPFAAENITCSQTSPSEHRRPHLRTGSAHSSGILEQAFMKKLAHEMQKRIEEERRRRGVVGGASGKLWCEVERELAGVGLGAGIGVGMGMGMGIGGVGAPPAYRQ